MNDTTTVISRGASKKITTATATSHEAACVLRVSSPRRQWYHHRLVPWQHVVPVAANLSNLPDVLAWCQRHPQRCEAIAQAGQALALEVVHQLEQDQRQAVARYAATWLRTRAA